MRVCLIAIALLATLQGARAAPVEIATQTCQDWLDASDDEQDLMVAWLHGYLAGRATSTLYDFAGQRADAAILKRYCQGHLTTGVISAAGQWKR